MKYTILPLAIIVATVVACNNGSGPKTTTSDQPANFTLPANPGPAQQPGQVVTNTTTTTTLPGVNTQPAPTPTQTVASVNTSKAGLNPEHGQPGHRCELAVGAPLDSKPATTPVITNSPANTTPVNITSPSRPVDVQKTFVTSPTTTTTTPTTTKAGLNPEHGQPGHRCDISVGAPLDSKPAATPTVTNTQVNNGQTTTSIPQVTPVLPAKTDAVTAPGMNPEHGKPGHRCDIAVGAPLDSKPTVVTAEKEKNIPTEKKN